MHLSGIYGRQFKLIKLGGMLDCVLIGARPNEFISTLSIWLE